MLPAILSQSERAIDCSSTAAPRLSLPDRSSKPAIRPLKLTGQADFSLLRSVAGEASRLLCTERRDSYGLAVTLVGWAPNWLIVICRCQDSGSNARDSATCLVNSGRRSLLLEDFLASTSNFTECARCAVRRHLCLVPVPLRRHGPRPGIA